MVRPPMIELIVADVFEYVMPDPDRVIVIYVNKVRPDVVILRQSSGIPDSRSKHKQIVSREDLYTSRAQKLFEQPVIYRGTARRHSSVCDIRESDFGSSLHLRSRYASSS